MIAKSTLAVAGLAVVALSTVSGAANAGHRHHRHFFFGHHNHHRLHIVPVYRDCGFYREMWEDTGRFYWKRKYYICKGWW
jgi:hypothetical protein